MGMLVIQAPQGKGPPDTFAMGAEQRGQKTGTQAQEELQRTNREKRLRKGKSSRGRGKVAFV